MTRAKGLDILKAICAFLVVCIHSAMAGTFVEYYIAITRVAVPVFFIISGFFYSDIVQNNKKITQLKKVLWLILMANTVFFVWDIIWGKIHSVSISDTVAGWYTKSDAKNLILFNESPFSGHLWYLNALLYVLLIMLLVERVNAVRIMYFFIPVLLAADLVFGKYSLFFLGETIPYIYTRHFLFVGLPYFLIGMVIKDRKQIWQSISPRFYLCFSIMFLFCNLLERYEIVIHNLDGIRDHYINTTFLAVSMFCFFYLLQIPDGNHILSFLADVGRDDSAYIYIIHPIFISILRELAQKEGILEWFQFITPFAAYILSIVIIRLIRKATLFRHYSIK